jgi:uncharacterized membrane protein
MRALHLWDAHWGATCSTLPPNWGRLRFWQYSATGSARPHRGFSWLGNDTVNLVATAAGALLAFWA